MNSTGSLDIIIHEILGRGGHSIVYRGVDASTGQVVAVKKSRCPLRIRRPLLEYEGLVLLKLQGHPSIPIVHGYGRFPHFEYLAIEQCGPSIQDLKRTNKGGTSLRTVLRVAQQMISALEHIHLLGFVHRDVKPNNMMVSLKDPTRILLVDYDLTIPSFKKAVVKRYDPEVDCEMFPGTLKWASLNAHNGFNLSWRDDLESLAFSLLYLLRGNLPWEILHIYTTTIGKMAQVRMLKELWPGTRLGKIHPAEFGRFLDESRSLDPQAITPYAYFLTMFNTIYHRSGYAATDHSLDWLPVTDKPCCMTSTLIASPDFPSVSHELWDRLRDGDCLSTALPAVVINTGEDEKGRHLAVVATLRSRLEETGCKPVHPTDITPSWPNGELSCYVYPEPLVCYIGEVLPGTSCTYRINEDLLQVLERQLSRPVNISDRDQEARMKIERLSHIDQFPMVARIKPLAPDDELDWNSEHAWFDTIVQISQQRATQNLWPWNEPGPGETEREEDSLRGGDFDLWDYVQTERDPSLTVSDWKSLISNLASNDLNFVLIPKIHSVDHGLAS